ncbi:YXWGXW repeat-containing protein [Flavobacterium sangjuense]|uniref:YXWGXW repeat-containing protein n=1 Tax=Flavobacterium sangjuense TaxID=2518177 RepID=A0A4P7PUE0_9FLAO|nr:YXWGXW repeat-containing protein [Flavobacterium sangjuense]QBZ98578.1 hypothetical protein GS03_02087 [Flavobacterium sangjuense]
MEKTIKLLLCMGFFLLLNSCAVGYVESEPTYVAVSRPPQPSATYVWIEGNWVWTNNNYVYRQGYWARPRPGRTYVSGYWRHEPRGYVWVKGRWN